MDKTNETVWCAEPFLQMAHTASGHYKICCIGEVDRDADCTTFNTTPKEFFNGDVMQQARLDMINGDPTQFAPTTKAACQLCIKNHNQSIISRRDNVTIEVTSCAALKNKLVGNR